jgi:nucleosome binding factor SPN SPT16 subunit
MLMDNMLPDRYSSYCANIARTLFVDPSKQQEQEYSAVLAAQTAAIGALVEGAPMSAAYTAAVAALQVGRMAARRP